MNSFVKLINWQISSNQMPKATVLHGIPTRSLHGAFSFLTIQLLNVLPVAMVLFVAFVLFVETVETVGIADNIPAAVAAAEVAYPYCLAVENS